jgi:hypothetical protein
VNWDEKQKKQNKEENIRRRLKELNTIMGLVL